MAERKIVEWDQLLDLVLDEDNPRHEPTSDRAEIIRQMVLRESVLPLARDIVEVGLSPLESFGGMQDGDHIVILEGNRRLTALLLLHDPSLAPVKERPAFVEMAKTFDPMSVTIEVTVLPNRAEANKWITRKHQGAFGGVGPREWDAVQKARFAGESSGNALALSILEYAEEHGVITAEQRAGRILTTVTRYVSNREVREDGFGITTGRDNADFELSVPGSVFRKRLSKFFLDLFDKESPVGSRTKAKERAAYARETLSKIGVNTTAPEAPASDNGGTQGDGDETNNEGHAQGDGRDPAGGRENAPKASAESRAEDSAEDLTPEGDEGEGSEAGDGAELKPTTRAKQASRKNFLVDAHRFTTPNSKIQRIVEELAVTDKKHPLGAALLARVLIEASFFTYAERTTGKQFGANDSSHVVIKDTLEDLRKAQTSGVEPLTRDQRQALDLFKTYITDKKYVLSPFYLGAVAHGQAFPDWDHLINKWDEVEPIVAYVSNRAE